MCDRVSPVVLAKLKTIASTIGAEFQEAMQKLPKKPRAVAEASSGEPPSSLLPLTSGEADGDLVIEAELEEEPFADVPGVKKELVQKLSDRLFNEMLSTLIEMPQEDIPNHGYCHVHNDLCPFEEPSSPEKPTLWIAGTTCTDECPTGSKRQLTGKAALPFMVFMNLLRQSQPDLFLHECTHLFNVDRLRDAIGEFYHLFPVTASPSDFGVPYTRARLFTWCVHKRHPIPADAFSPSNLDPFRMGTVLEGDGFFSAPTKWVDAYIERRKLKANPMQQRPCHGTAVRSPGFALRGMKSLLSGGDLARIRSQEVEELQRRGEIASDPRVVLSDGICMKGQTNAFSKVKTLMPSLMTRSVPWSFRWKRELAPVEALGVMGIPVFSNWIPPAFQGAYGCPYSSVLETLTDADVRRLAGNGMSLQVMGAMFVAGLSSFARFLIPKAKQQQANPSVAEGGFVDLEADSQLPS